jgi:hypothetical protein
VAEFIDAAEAPSDKLQRGAAVELAELVMGSYPEA